MRFFLHSIRIIVHIILSLYTPNFDRYLWRYKNTLHQEAAITQSSPFLNQFMRFFLQSIRVIVHIILSPYEPNFDQYLRRYKNILEIPLIPLTPTHKNPYPWWGVQVFVGIGVGVHLQIPGGYPWPSLERRGPAKFKSNSGWMLAYSAKCHHLFCVRGYPLSYRSEWRRSSRK